MNLWLNSDEKWSNLQKELERKQDQKFAIEKDLASRLNTDTYCLGIVFRKEGGNKTATLTSWKCDTKRSFLCSLNIFQFKSPLAKSKLPCFSSKTRPKRDDEEQIDNYEEEKYGK